LPALSAFFFITLEPMRRYSHLVNMGRGYGRVVGLSAVRCVGMTARRHALPRLSFAAAVVEGL